MRRIIDDEPPQARLHVRVSMEAELQELLDKSPDYDFSIVPWSSPNGWKIFAVPKRASWWQRFWGGRSRAHMGPPFEINTDDPDVAVAMSVLLRGTRYRVTLRR